jgi:ubiquinone/menaquinone biosynthesis C-methylase UbiE
MTATERYPLGYSTAEFERLNHQARFLRVHTLQLLREARLMPGQQVLDLGCGLGDVSLIAAELVGPRGFVVGVDCSEQAVHAARARALDAGVSNVEYVVGDIEALTGHREYDAIVGRLIMMYLRNPAATLTNLRARLRKGGSIVLQEVDVDTASALPSSPLLDAAREWIRTAFELAGANPNAGTSLYRTLRDAGYDPRFAFVSQPTFTPGHAAGAEWIAATVRSLLPTLERHGIATSDRIGIDTLATRLRSELESLDAIVFGPRFVGLWAKV